MKIDRMIGILSVLLQKDHVTAPELAERFEVSRRTVNRDIDSLCRAGIPIQTMQGSGGGIRIMDGYSVERTLLSSNDMKMILAGLRSLDSVSGSRCYSTLMERLKPGSSGIVAGSDSILIDLSSWNHDIIAPKVTLIRDAIDDRRMISFAYSAPRGESKREIEPYYLIFKWSSWYVYGYCTVRNDFRMFKLNRMYGVTRVEREFRVRNVPLPELSIEKLYPPTIKVKAIVDPEVSWRLVEEYGPDCYSRLPDGRLIFEGNYSKEVSLIAWVLTFGDKMEILEPISVRERLLMIAGNITRLYGGN